jgi:flagellar motor switch protein FliN/FliY
MGSVTRPAAGEAATLVAEALGLQARPSEGFDLWGKEPGHAGEAVPKGSTVWTADLVGAAGPGGEIALALPPGTEVPEEASVGAALARGVAALVGVFGAAQVGEVRRSGAEALTTPRAGHHALAVPLLPVPPLTETEATKGGQRAGLLVLITPVGQVAELPHLDPSPGPTATRSIAAFGDVEMTVSVELGRTKIPIRDLLSIHNGAVVQLDRAVSHPVDLFVQGTLIARGEVVVVDECFAVRVTELLTGD